MGAVAAASRGLGAVRVLVVAAVLGTTYLGNAFQGANQLSTVIFELVAAGALSAVLVPSFVELLDEGRDREAEHLAGGVLALALLGLGALAVVGVLAAPWLAGILTSAVEDPRVRSEQRDLTAFLLRFFVPQIVLYGLGAIATAVLHARRSFVIPAAAPIGNTVVMVGLLVAFRLTAGSDPGLRLDGTERLLLAAAGTLGVAAFVAVPTVALIGGGFVLRPRLALGDAAVRRLLALGGWATVQHAAIALLLGAAVVVGGGVAGGVVAFQVGWYVFLAPYGVIAQPIQTTMQPELVGEWLRGDRDAFGRSLRWGIGSTAVLLAPVAAALLVLAAPLAEVVAVGAARSGDGVGLIGVALASLAPGIVVYGIYLLLARAFYAIGDSRTPALVSVVTAAAAALVMLIGASATSGRSTVVLLGLAHTGAFTVAATILAVLLHRRTGVGLWPREGGAAALAALLLAGGTWGVKVLVAPDGRLDAAIVLGVGALLLGATVLAVRRLGLLSAHPVDVVEPAPPG